VQQSGGHRLRACRLRSPPTPTADSGWGCPLRYAGCSGSVKPNYGGYRGCAQLFRSWRASIIWGRWGGARARKTSRSSPTTDMEGPDRDDPACADRAFERWRRRGARHDGPNHRGRGRLFRACASRGMRGNDRVAAGDRANRDIECREDGRCGGAPRRYVITATEGAALHLDRPAHPGARFSIPSSRPL